MDINLEKIDTIRERTGASYKEAKEALERNNGNVVEALIDLEEQGDKSWVDSMGIAGNDVIEKLKRIIKKGNVTKVILKKDGDVLLNIPITAGAIGIALSPMLSILGVSAALATKCSIEIVKDSGEVVDINDIVDEAATDFKNKFKTDKTDKTDKTSKSEKTIITEDIDEALEDLNDGTDF